MTSPEQEIHRFDVAVIGGGPAGAEAAMAAAGNGASVICLAINLDTVGFPPATPVLAWKQGDRRIGLLEEMRSLGGRLPGLLEQAGVLQAGAPGSGTGRDAESGAGDDSEGGAGDETAYSGAVLVDRRNLGLAYKEALESSDGLQVRQALAVELEPPGSQSGGGAPTGSHGWRITCSLDEVFTATNVVVAAGTFLQASVDDGGVVVPGGRPAEIQSSALAKSLARLGLRLEEVTARTSPRLDARAPDEKGQTPAARHSAIEDETAQDGFLPDGSQLGELLSPLRASGSRARQLATLRAALSQEGSWLTRPGYSVRHLTLSAAQLSETLEALVQPGLFFAGRAAGACSYLEAAATGAVAGLAAGRRAAGEEPDELIKDYKVVSELCAALAGENSRPVTVRHGGPGC